MRFCFAIIIILFGAGPLWAGPKSAVAKEVAEFLFKKGTKEVVEHGIEAFARRLESLAIKHGDDVIHAVRAVGPRAMPLIEKEGSKAAKIMCKHGEKGMIHIVERPGAMKLVAQHGEEAAVAMVKHPGLAEPLIEKVGAASIPALTAIGPQSARRLAIMAEGEVAHVATNPKVLEVIARYGERGAEFVWRHKGSLAIGAVLTAFLIEPEKFIDGTKDITKIVAEDVVKPIVETPAKVLSPAAEKIADKALPEVAKNTNWSVVIPFGIASLGALIGWFLWINRRPRAIGVNP